MLSSVCPSSAPEFLCDHYGFCDVIPPNCIQMRNLILSAFPTNMRLPDPFKVSTGPKGYHGLNSTGSLCLKISKYLLMR